MLAPTNLDLNDSTDANFVMADNKLNKYQITDKELSKDENKKESIKTEEYKFNGYKDQEKIFLKDSFSSNYIKFNLEVFIDKILDNYIDWNETNSLYYLSKNKELMKINEKYLKDNDTSKLFFSFLSIFYQGNYWTSMDESKQKNLILELKKLRKDPLDENAMNKFLQQLYRLQIFTFENK